MLRFRHIVFALVSAGLLSIIPPPAEASGDTLSVRDLVDEALARNPDVQALEEALAAAKHGAGAAGGFPDPTVSYSYFIEELETRLGPQRSILQLVQPVPFPGKLSLKEKIAGYDVFATEERLRLARLEIVKEVKSAFYSIAAIDESLVLIEGIQSILDRFEEIVAARLETGTAYQQDLLKVDIERLKLDERKIEYRKRRKSLVYHLNALLDREPDSPIYVSHRRGVFPITASVDELVELARNQPELRLARHSIEKRNLSLSLSRKKYLPDFTIGMNYFNIGEAPLDVPESGRNAWSVTLGVKVPLWFGKIREEAREQRSTLRYLERSYDATRARIAAKILDLHNQYRVALEIVELYRGSLLPRAEQSLEAAEAGYISGEVDFLHLLDSERTVLELGLALTDKKAEAERLIAELEFSVGAEITRIE
jgi:cobalt-zinc-cadmium efflux system outer membrane protein